MFAKPRTQKKKKISRNRKQLTLYSDCCKQHKDFQLPLNLSGGGVTGSNYVVQLDFKLMMTLLAQTSECGDYTCVPQALANP